jgi:hypothetical protein
MLGAGTKREFTCTYASTETPRNTQGRQGLTGQRFGQPR